MASNIRQVGIFILADQEDGDPGEMAVVACTRCNYRWHGWFSNEDLVYMMADHTREHVNDAQKNINWAGFLVGL